MHAPQDSHGAPEQQAQANAPRLVAVSAASVYGSAEFMRSDLARSGLTSEDIHAEPTADFIPGYLIPYWTVTGERHPRMWRKRHASERRYDQPDAKLAGDDVLHPYIPPGTRGLKGETLIIAEGEKKAAAIVKMLGVPAIGIGGMSNWRSRAGKVDVHPATLELINARGVRKVVIVPDGDIGRYDVAKEYGTLASQLRAEGLDVEIVRLPRNTKIDDLLVSWGTNSAAQFALLPRVVSLVESPKLLVERYGLSHTTTQAGAVRLEQNVANALMLLRNHPAFPHIWHNSDTDRIMFADAVCSLDQHGVDVLEFFQHNLCMPKITFSVIKQALARRAYDNARSPFREYLEGLKWDGTPRLETMFPRLCGAPDNDFTREVGRKWLPGAVWRTYEPGCPVDFMLITHGPQGRGKSTLPSLLWGAENVVSIVGREMQHKDNLMLFHAGKCISFEEFDTMGTADIGHLKGIITNKEDRYRRPYGTDVEAHARSCVFYASTNRSIFLKPDPSGYRRYVVVPFAQLAFGSLLAERDQLWAEAVAFYHELKARNGLYELSNVTGATEQASAHVHDDEPILRWMEEEARVLRGEAAPDQCRNGYVWLKTAQVYSIAGCEKRREDQRALKEHLQRTGWTYHEKGPAEVFGGAAKREERVWIRKRE